MLYLILFAALIGSLGLLLVLYALLGKGPRIRRAFRQIDQLLNEGHWEQALEAIDALQVKTGLTTDSAEQGNRRAAEWVEELRRVSAQAHQAAADQALKNKEFDAALQHGLRVASLENKPASEAQTRVVEAMLAEVRRQFAAGTGEKETAAIYTLLGEVAKIQPDCPEASFWRSLCLIRQHQLEPALEILLKVHEQVGKTNLDAALYVGGLLHRLGRPQDAIRYLAEANRVEPNCILVPWQMGLALVAGNGDSSLAVRALQRALGSRGLLAWTQTPNKLWVETFPEGRSFLRRLAARYPYSCPLFGDDLNVIIRQGQLGLAQAFYRQGSYQEAADLYTKLMGDSPPTLVLLRGIGLSLARLGKYDQAYKHLRAALDIDESKDALTAGYLALCGAMGKPTNPADKPKNIAWAIRLLARYPITGNLEWANIYSNVFGEARALEMPLSEEDQVQLCNVLASVNAIDAQAAAGYSQLAQTYPDRVSLRHAWLYCQAATLHKLAGPADLDLFARTFRDAAPAKDFFSRQQWNLDDVQYSYLDRCARLAPGNFPEVLGSEYRPQGEGFLLQRSRKEEEAGRKDAALEAVQVLLNLAPTSVAGFDRLACLHYREGDLDRAVAMLDGWRRLAPCDHWPLVRQAIIEQQRGNIERRRDAIDTALGLTGGALQASIAFLGARLALRDCVKDWQQAPPTRGIVPLTEPLGQTLTLLQQCLQADPGHLEGLWCLAAVYSVLGDQDQLQQLAPRLDRPDVTDGRFHYLGAVSQLARQDYERVIELSRRAAVEESLAVECHYLAACAYLHLNDARAAVQSLLKVAAKDTSPSAEYARGLLGRLSYDRQAYDEAIKWWNQVDARRRNDWNLEEPLRQTVLLAGLLAFGKERYEAAGDRFREAGKLGLRDRRLGPLLILALVKAGQRLLFEQGAK